MSRFRYESAVLLLCIPLQTVFAQTRSSPLEALTHLYKYPIVSKTPVPIDLNSAEFYNHAPLFDPAVTKYALETDSATTPSCPTNVTVKTLQGGAALVLNPRPDNDVAKATVQLDIPKGKDCYLNYVRPCDWSPDGRKLLISGRDFAGQNYAEQTYSIWAVDLKTMRGTPISGFSNGGATGGAGFSPDGKCVAYAVYSLQPGKSRKGHAPAARQARTFIAYADGSQPRRLAQGTDPTWSPDSKRLLLSDGGRIWMMDTEGRHKRLLSSPQSIQQKIRSQHLFIGPIHWLDNSHFVLTATTWKAERKSDRKEMHAVWILDETGKRLQVLPSLSLNQCWADRKKMIVQEDSGGSSGRLWLLKY